MNYKQAAHIVLNITIISKFIGFLFFTYGKRVEKQIVQDQSEYIAKTIANDIKIFIPNELKIKLKEQLKVPDMSKEDAAVEKSNSELQKKAMIVLGVLFLIGIFTTIVICIIGDLNFRVLLESIVILFFVALTEILFLNLVARNYKIADPNFVKRQLLESIKEQVSKPDFGV